jgi:hypothetical protein
MSRDRVDGAVGLDKQFEHPATRRMADSPKDIRFAIASRQHAVTLHKQTFALHVRSKPLSSRTRGSSKYFRKNRANLAGLSR